ncbi:hypothetical protein NDU88_004978 [Pleurodeles waltl]|uniref:Uncharacterized protein n=1 Tax=Pleurodeles waltl TaxID=8319 RepID=A0AAV7MV16_PLEWA|nr:hypothetical protein NDU88_004978 [Pleurodeles waltl]
MVAVARVKGGRASYHDFLGGASLRCGPVHHSRLQLVLLPQASGPCSALPTVQQGRALLLRPGHRPHTASSPSQMLRCCTGGLRCAPSAATLVPQPVALRRSAPRQPSWIVARPRSSKVVLQSLLFLLFTK